MMQIGDWSTLVLDIGTIALMLAVLVACFVVYRRLEAVRAHQRELGELIARLERAGRTAQTAVESLRQEASGIGEQLEGRIATGRGLRDELAVIVESGTALAERLEILLTERRREVVDELRTVRAGGHTDGTLEEAETAGAAVPSPEEEPLPPARLALLDALKEAR